MATKKAPTRKARESKVPENEDKAARFRRVGTQRLRKATKAIRLLRPLANRAQYEYTDEQVATILEQLANAVEQVNNAFEQKASHQQDVEL